MSKFKSPLLHPHWNTTFTLPLPCSTSALICPSLRVVTDAFAATQTFVTFALPCRHTLQTGQVLHGPRRCIVMFKEGNTSLKTWLGLGCIPVLARCHIESAPSVPEPRTRTEIMHYRTQICLDWICPQPFKKTSSVITAQILFGHIFSVYVSPLCCFHDVGLQMFKSSCLARAALAQG